MSDTFDEFSDLLGAYALDAVEQAEREAIELHVLECPRCRAEVAEHREVAAMLASSGAPAPDGVWDRIVAELSPPAPPLRLTVTAPEQDETEQRPAAEVVSIATAPSRRQGRIVLAVGAVAASIVAVLAFVAVRQTQQVDRLNTALDDRTVESLANDVVAHSAVSATLEGDAGTAQAVVGESGQGYLITDEMPAVPEGDVYQLWGKVDDTVLSLGTFSGDASVVPFSVDPERLDDIELFAVTQERAPGVVASSEDPLMAGTV